MAVDNLVSESTPPEFTTRQRLKWVIILGLLHTLGTLTVDVYLPAFPLIRGEFDVSTAAVQLTLTGAMVGMMLGQLVIGVWSDRVGRKLPLALSAITHVIASLLCASSVNIEMLMAARFLQGAASAATIVVSLAIVRDMFSGHRMIKMLAGLALVYGMAIVIGPLLGSTLLLVMTWRGVFLCLAAYALTIGLLALFGLTETLPPERRRGKGVRILLERYRFVLRDRVFIGLVIVSGASWAGMYNYLASSSFLFQDIFGLSQIGYGIAFASHAIFMLFGNQISARLAKGIQPQWILAVTLVGLLLAPLSIIAFQGLGLWGVLVPLWIYTLMLGASKPMIQGLALGRHGRDAGIAASLLGGLNIGMGAIASPIAGAIGITSALPVAGVMAVCSAIAVLVFWVVVRPRSLPQFA